MIGNLITPSAHMSLMAAEKMLTDVSAENFGRLATSGDRPIESNHPAFVFGHLSLYPSRVVAELGGDATAIQPSEKYEALFSPGKSCLDDPEGKLYPPREEIVDRFFTGMRAAIDALQSTEDAIFMEPNPNEKMRAHFETKGMMHNFYLGGHVMLHLGQISAWRRAMGMSPA